MSRNKRMTINVSQIPELIEYLSNRKIDHMVAINELLIKDQHTPDFLALTLTKGRNLMVVHTKLIGLITTFFNYRRRIANRNRVAVAMNKYGGPRDKK